MTIALSLPTTKPAAAVRGRVGFRQAVAAEAALTLHELTPIRASLEDAFMELTSDSVEYRSRDRELVPAR